MEKVLFWNKIIVIVVVVILLLLGAAVRDAEKSFSFSFSFSFPLHLKFSPSSEDEPAVRDAQKSVCVGFDTQVECIWD